MNKKELLEVIEEVIEEGNKNKMKKKKAQKKKKARNKLPQKKVESALEAWAEMKPTDAEIKEAKALIKAGKIDVDLNEEGLSRIQKIGMVIMLGAQLFGQVSASPVGDLVSSLLGNSPDNITMTDPSSPSGGDFEGIHGGAMTVDDGTGANSFTLNVNLSDDVLDMIGDSGITANELGAVIMDNMAGEDFDGVEDGLSSQDLGDLAMSTARAILN